MTDNERIQGRVLSEIEISHVDTFSKLALGSADEREVATARLCLKLIATIHERDKTIAELKYAKWNREMTERIVQENKQLRQQNTIMLSALEQLEKTLADHHGGTLEFTELWCAVEMITNKTIAKAKALTVSKRAVAEETAVTSEQTT